MSTSSRYYGPPLPSSLCIGRTTNELEKQYDFKLNNENLNEAPKCDGFDLKSKFRFSPSPSQNSIKINPDEVVYRTSSLALLRAKQSNSRNRSTGEEPQYGEKSKETTVSHPDRVNSTDIDWARRVVNFMYNLWKNHEMCDVRLQTLNGEVLAHKLVLAAFVDDTSRRHLASVVNHMVSLDLQDYPSDVVIPVLSFLYTQNLNLSDENIRGTLGVGLRLGLDIVIERCLKYLEGFNITNVLHYHAVCQQYGLTRLQSQVCSFICDRFSEVSLSRHFVWLSLEELLDIILNDDLVVDSELILFKAIVRWVEFNRQERIEYLPSLLRCVHFQKLSPEVLIKDVEEKHQYIFVIPSCRQMLFEAMCFHALNLSDSPLALSYAPPLKRHRAEIRFEQEPIVIKPIKKMPPTGEVDLLSPPYDNFSNHQLNRRPSFSTAADSAFLATRSQMRSTDSSRTTSQPVCIIVGGIDLHSLDSDLPGRSVFAYDMELGDWRHMTSLHSYTHHHGVAWMNGKLYVVGGAVYDSCQPDQLGSATSSVQMFDPETNMWSRLADMKESRAYVGVTCHDGYLYAIGGEDDNRRKLNTIEKYDPLLDSWSYVARMPGGGRIGAACVIHNNQLYIIGGYSHTYKANPVLSDILCYDLNKDCWVAKTQLIIPRCHASAIEINGRLYLIGGRTKLDGCNPPISSLGLVEVYDDVNDSWEHITDLTVPRHDAAVAAIGNHLYVMGGMKTPSPFCLQSLEILDVETNNWIDNAKPLPHPATGIASCTLYM